MSDLALDEDGNPHFNTKNNLASMPTKYIGEFYNGCVDPCDMLSGPCACGAWHHQEEWPNKLQLEVFGSISHKPTICKRKPKKETDSENK